MLVFRDEIFIFKVYKIHKCMKPWGTSNCNKNVSIKCIIFCLHIYTFGLYITLFKNQNYFEYLDVIIFDPLSVSVDSRNLSY